MRKYTILMYKLSIDEQYKVIPYLRTVTAFYKALGFSAAPDHIISNEKPTCYACRVPITLWHLGLYMSGPPSRTWWCWECAEQDFLAENPGVVPPAELAPFRDTGVY